jgi:hypothetical protein
LIKDAEYAQKLRVDISLYNYTGANPFTSGQLLVCLLSYLEITVELENKIRHTALEKISINLLRPMFFYKYNYDLT